MKEFEIIKNYSDTLFGIVYKVRLIDTKFTDYRIVEKPEKYEAFITSLENTSKITLAELLNVLQAQEQQWLMRQDLIAEGAPLAMHQDVGKNKKKNYGKNQASSSKITANNQIKSNGRNSKKNYPPCQHYGKTCHLLFKCWKRLDVKCSKCNQFGHEFIICKRKIQKQEADVQVVDQDKEDQIFMETCFSTMSSSECWLIDSDCTNHMT